MFTAKRILFLLGIFFISCTYGYSQKPSDLIQNPANENLIIPGNDSINKKHSQAFLEGKEDAKEYFNSNRAFALSFFTSLLPPVGLVTTVVISFQKPTVEIQDLPNKQLLRNAEYSKGYVQKAKRMNTAKAWGGCVTGMAFFGIAYLMLYGIN